MTRLLSSLLLATATTLVAADDLRLERDENTGTISIHRITSPQAILTQVAGPTTRPYLHPIVAPDGKGELTEFSPGHHKHQTGLYWGFTRVNKRDYFHNLQSDYWKRNTSQILIASGQSVSWQTSYDLLDTKGQPVLTQTQTWTMSSSNQEHILDLNWQGTAKTDVTIGKWNYGGLFLRMPWHKGKTKGEVINSALQKNNQAEGKRAVWVDVGMDIEGRDDWGHITIFDHPKNSDFPLPWRVDGQLGIGPSRAILGDWKIPKGQTETIRHRFLIHTGKLNPEALTKKWESYSKLPYRDVTFISTPAKPVPLIDLNQARLENIVEMDRDDELSSIVGAPVFGKQRLFDDQRYPNVVVTVKGTVLAVWGNSGVAVRRSEDGGKSWGRPIPVARAGYHGGGTIVDANSGDILVFVEERQPPAPLTLYRSQDDGRSWQPQATVIAKDVNGNRPSMHMNEHGITLLRGPHKGRLLRPSRYYGPKDDEENWPRQYTNAIYSDDGGKTWNTSEPFPEKGTGEAALVEFADGRIYYNSRLHWPKRPRNGRRREAWSVDGGASWRNWKIVEVLPDGDQGRPYGCMGGLARLPLDDRDVLIFSNLDTNASHRERVTVWASFDGGTTWPVKRLVDEGRSGYSSLAVGRPGTTTAGWIYLHYEQDPFKGSHLARFNLAWLLGGKPTGDGEIPNLKLK